MQRKWLKEWMDEWQDLHSKKRKPNLIHDLLKLSHFLLRYKWFACCLFTAWCKIIRCIISLLRNNTKWNKINIFKKELKCVVFFFLSLSVFGCTSNQSFNALYTTGQVRSLRWIFMSMPKVTGQKWDWSKINILHNIKMSNPIIFKPKDSPDVCINSLLDCMTGGLHFSLSPDGGSRWCQHG